jgi:hypothetical protein
MSAPAFHWRPSGPELPKVEVVGLPNEKVEELFWDTITQVRAEQARRS